MKPEPLDQIQLAQQTLLRAAIRYPATAGRIINVSRGNSFFAQEFFSCSSANGVDTLNLHVIDLSQFFQAGDKMLGEMRAHYYSGNSSTAEGIKNWIRETRIKFSKELPVITYSITKATGTQEPVKLEIKREAATEKKLALNEDFAQAFNNPSYDLSNALEQWDTLAELKGADFEHSAYLGDAMMKRIRIKVAQEVGVFARKNNISVVYIPVKYPEANRDNYDCEVKLPSLFSPFTKIHSAYTHLNIAAKVFDKAKAVPATLIDHVQKLCNLEHNMHPDFGTKQEYVNYNFTPGTVSKIATSSITLKNFEEFLQNNKGEGCRIFLDLPNTEPSLIKSYKFASFVVNDRTYCQIKMVDGKDKNIATPVFSFGRRNGRGAKEVAIATFWEDFVKARGIPKEYKGEQLDLEKAESKIRANPEAFEQHRYCRVLDSGGRTVVR